MIAAGKAAPSKKGLRLPKRVTAWSDSKPTTGAQSASQTEPAAQIAPATAGLIPATVVKNNSKYVPANIYIALSQVPPIP